MLNIQFLDEGGTSCKAAVLPIVEQVAPATYDSATDGTTAVVIQPTNAGGLAPFGGSFVNQGCSPLAVVVTYVKGGNCTPCDDPDVLSTEQIKWTIPANAVAPIPDGFWTEIEYTLVNAANDAKVQTVSFQSSYTPDCPNCSILLSDVT